jgi:hypothetical protein
MRDVFAMLFAGNLAFLVINVENGNALGTAVNGFAAAIGFYSWFTARADDKRRQNNG